MTQILSRFLLERLNNDYRSIQPASTTLEQGLFGIQEPVNIDELLSRILPMSHITTMKCVNCRNEQTRRGTSFVNDLLYPPQKPPVRGGKAPKTTFSQILKMSVERETTAKGWCKQCQRYLTLQSRKTIYSLPAVLALNAAVVNTDVRRLWMTPGWLPEEIGIIITETGEFFCYEGNDLQLHLQRGIYNISVYSLVGLVVNIESIPPQKPHLVAMVNSKYILFTRVSPSISIAFAPKFSFILLFRGRAY
jgi:PAB-dependent poly(A)-specific ribonuclease subunit 2